MANQIKTNSLATLVAIRAAEAAGYFTVGSKKYFAGQLEGKRNGQTYRFVLKDTADAVNSLEIGASDKTSIVEREVSMTLQPWHVAVKTDAIEAVTDMDMDKEVAEPNGQKLVNAAVKAQIAKDLSKCGTAFVGSGFAPLSQASAHLASITNEDLYGFIDPNVEAILTSNGQMFVPVNAPDMYSKGLLGKFHGAEYRAQRFLPSVKVSSVLEAWIDAATVTSYTDNTDGTASIVIGNSTGISAADKISKGMVIWMNGVKACDTIGDPTSQDKAWIVMEDVAIAASATSATIKVASVSFVGGTKDIANEDGSELTAAGLAGKSLVAPEAGNYFCGIVRANGAMEFETLDKLDAAGADYSKETVEGITVHQNKIVDLSNMTNTTRFDTVILAGVVDQRAQSYFMVK